MASYSYPTNITPLPVAANSVSANATASAAQPTDVVLTAEPTASTIVKRDSNANFAVNLLGLRRTPTTASASSLLLTLASAFYQSITGSLNQTVVLPDVTSLTRGVSFFITTATTGTVTVTSSGGESICVLATGNAVLVTCLLTTGTGAASWQSSVMIGKAATAATASNMLQYDASGNTIVQASMITQEDIASVNGTVTLTSTSAGMQFVTGSTSGTIIKLPDTSTLSSSPPDSWEIYNTSTALVTIKSFDGTLLLVIPPGTGTEATCISTAANDSTAWIAPFLTAPIVGLMGKYISSTTTLSSTPAVIVWTSINYGTDGIAFTSGIYTAKWPGVVKVSTGLRIAATFSANNTVIVELSKNGTTVAQRTFYAIAGVTEVSTTLITLTSVAVGDTLSIKVSTTGTSPSIIAASTGTNVMVAYV